MSEEKRKILQMLQDGKITVEQAEKLLKAVENASPTGWIEDEPVSKPGVKPRWLRVLVDGNKHRHGEGKHERVNIRVPLGLIRAGVKLGSIVPGKSRDKINHALSDHGIGLDIENLDPKSLEALIDALKETTIDIQDGQERVRVFVE